MNEKEIHYNNVKNRALTSDNGQILLHRIHLNKIL